MTSNKRTVETYMDDFRTTDRATIIRRLAGYLMERA